MKMKMRLLSFKLTTRRLLSKEMTPMRSIETRLPLLALLAFSVEWPLPAAGQNDVVKGPSGLSLNCSQFTKGADGSWQSTNAATLTYPSRQGSFADNQFGKNGISINGTDLAGFLDKHCPR